MWHTRDHVTRDPPSAPGRGRYVLMPSHVRHCYFMSVINELDKGKSCMIFAPVSTHPLVCALPPPPRRRAGACFPRVLFRVPLPFPPSPAPFRALVSLPFGGPMAKSELSALYCLAVPRTLVAVACAAL